MDVIYADENMDDIGVFLDYTLDLAYGKDENTFSLTIPLDLHCCKEHYYIYIEETEYGGVIDKIAPSTQTGDVVYTGRTWHGILEKKVLQPEENQAYLEFSGNPIDILQEIIEMCDLTDLFETETIIADMDELPTIEVRYQPAYTTIRKMFFENQLKLTARYYNKKVILSAIPLYDYSADEEWDSSQMTFSITKDYRPRNHLICLGQGDLEERAIIHLFADENGGVMPFSTTDDPIKKSDYILDKSQQQLFGADEYTEVYDYSSAEITENYEKLTTVPANWKNVYTNYYEKDDNGKFDRLEKTYVDVYTLLSSKPSNWSTNFGSYYTKSGSNYENVTGTESITYKAINKQPKDWSKQYKNYYYWSYDGVTTGKYVSVSAGSKTTYKVQTKQPSDWKNTYKSYYYRTTINLYKYLEKAKRLDGTWGKQYVTFETKKENENTATYKLTYVKTLTKQYKYVSISDIGAPAWKKNKYYTSVSKTVKPKWRKNYYYQQIKKTVAPTFATNKYYSVANTEYIPDFNSGEFFEKFEDYYYELAKAGVEKLMESYFCDKIAINLDAEEEYDINDVVGATENVTGINVSQPITKKIVKFRNEVRYIDYEIGEE